MFVCFFVGEGQLLFVVVWVKIEVIGFFCLIRMVYQYLLGVFKGELVGVVVVSKGDSDGVYQWEQYKQFYVGEVRVNVVSGIGFMICENIQVSRV